MAKLTICEELHRLIEKMPDGFIKDELLAVHERMCGGGVQPNSGGNSPLPPKPPREDGDG